MVGDESHKDMPYTQEATIRTHYKKLKKFIKLIDYFLIDVKLTLISSSTTKVLKRIKRFNYEAKVSRAKDISLAPILIINQTYDDDRKC